MISRSQKETEKIAEVFISKLLKKEQKRSGALVVGLSGNLGSGKTAFVKAAAKYFGIRDTVTSPTFVIMKKYRGFFFHLDAYRLKNEKELSVLGWRKIIGEKNNLVFIEWPENVRKAMPRGARYIFASYQKDGGRSFKLK